MRLTRTFRRICTDFATEIAKLLIRKGVYRLAMSISYNNLHSRHAPGRRERRHAEVNGRFQRSPLLQRRAPCASRSGPIGPTHTPQGAFQRKPWRRTAPRLAGERLYPSASVGQDFPINRLSPRQGPDFSRPLRLARLRRALPPRERLRHQSRPPEVRTPWPREWRSERLPPLRPLQKCQRRGLVRRPDSQVRQTLDSRLGVTPAGRPGS